MPSARPGAKPKLKNALSKTLIKGKSKNMELLPRGSRVIPPDSLSPLPLNPKEREKVKRGSNH
jgi:hypothetical protein